MQKINSNHSFMDNLYAIHIAKSRNYKIIIFIYLVIFTTFL